MIIYHLPLLSEDMLIGYGEGAVFILNGGDDKVIKISEKQSK
jgi:hypothetical protein